MNENKRLLVLFGAVIAIVVLILAIAFWPEKDESFVCGVKADKNYKKLGALNYDKYECLYATDSSNVIAYTSVMSAKDKKSLEKVAESINHTIYYLDADNISKSDMKKIKKDLKYSDNSFEKDVVLVVKDGKVTNYKDTDLTSSDDIKDFLSEAGIAKFAFDIKSDEEYENLGEVSYAQYKKLYDSDKSFALVLAQTTCSYCLKFKPIINEYADDNDLPIYIAEIDTWESDDITALQDSLKDYFDENKSWGTPTTLGIKDKKVVSSLSGYTDDTDEIDNFFSELGLK